MTEPSAVQVGEGVRPPIRRPWPTLPRWFWLAVAAAASGFVALIALAVGRILGFEEQPLFERRSPPAAGFSHDVGRFVLPQGAQTPVRCNALEGIRVEGDDEPAGVLADAVRGFCERLPTLDPALGDRVVAAARAGTIVSFGAFERTGDDSTTITGAPPRIVINVRYAATFKGYLLPLLAHEFWHAGRAVTAAEELAARRVEDAMCAVQPEVLSGRICSDADAITDHPDALAELRRVGYP